MQKYNTEIQGNIVRRARAEKSFVPSSFVTNPLSEIKEIRDCITNEQIHLLEGAIRQYNRLEEIKKYTSMVLEDIENMKQEELQKEAAKIENRLRAEKQIDIESLLNSDDFLRDLYADGFDN